MDQTTGEACLKPDICSQIPLEAFVATSKRLGNHDEIRYLREKISEIFSGKGSVILERVLYSASHSGDVIPSSEFFKLREEIRQLRMLPDASLNSFVESMVTLINCGILEENPIVFV
ncbi:MAG: hypothetical protein HQM08_28695 [Candidatus Riflebacteria bacterium]|nr:hypothetical protein [Candidatus Riflebacteria bacterium]